MLTTSIFETPASLGSALTDAVLNNPIEFATLSVTVSAVVTAFLQLRRINQKRDQEYRWRIEEIKDKLSEAVRDSRTEIQHIGDTASNRTHNASARDLSTKEQEEAMERLQRIADMEMEAEKALSTIRKNTGSIGVVTFDDAFRTEAKNHLTIAILLAVVLSILSIFFVVFFFDSFTDLTKEIEKMNDIVATFAHATSTAPLAPSSSAHFQLFWAKMLLVTFFSIVFFNLMKLINVNLHLHTLNKHRVNSLKTFEKFQVATTDTKIKDAILMKVVQVVFDAGDSGYVSGKRQNGDSGESGGTVRILEPIDYERIVRNIQELSAKQK